MPNGETALEIVDFDGSMLDTVKGISDKLGTQTYWTPGKAKLVGAGSDYERHARQHRGRTAHAASTASAAMQQAQQAHTKERR